MDKKPKKKTTAILTIILVLTVTLNLAIIGINHTISNEIKELQNTIKYYEEKLIILQESYEQNKSILTTLKEGDKYTLHDPLLEEVNDFLKNESSTKANTVINNAKNKGIRCAYVQVIISKSLFVKELIGFKIIDLEENMTFYEIKTHHQIKPLIGLNYSECFITGELDEPIYDQKIRDIIIIW